MIFECIRCHKFFSKKYNYEIHLISSQVFNKDIYKVNKNKIFIKRPFELKIKVSKITPAVIKMILK